MGPASPEAWRVVWFMIAAVGVRALTYPDERLWSLPFVVGASSAAATAWAGLLVPLEWIVFLVIGALTLGIEARLLAPRLGSLPPLARLGSARWIGREAVVRRAIPAGGRGSVRIGWDHFSARSEPDQDSLPKGTTVVVIGARSGGLIVRPAEDGDGKRGGSCRRRVLS